MIRRSARPPAVAHKRNYSTNKHYTLATAFLSPALLALGTPWVEERRRFWSAASHHSARRAGLGAVRLAARYEAFANSSRIDALYNEDSAGQENIAQRRG